MLRVSCRFINRVIARQQQQHRLQQQIIIKPSMCCCSTSSPQSKVITIAESRNQSLFERIIEKLPFVNVNKSKLSAHSFLLYESIADSINYAEFFDEFGLQDTFYSWFAVTELHLWMLMVRCMDEGDDGRLLRNMIVEAFWADVSLRAKKLGSVSHSLLSNNISELNEQFQAALIAYDEGLQSDDVVLAAALWRRLYQMGDVEPEQLENLVKYVRQKILFLDRMEKVTEAKQIDWDTCVK